MTWKPTALLAVAVGLLAVLTVWLDRRVTSTQVRLSRAAHVVSFGPDTVKTLRIERDGFSAALQKHHTGWRIVAPIQAPADAASVARMLAALETLPRVEIITQDQRLHRGLSLVDYGLEIPEITLTLETAHDRHILEIGHQTPLGELVYVKRDHDTDVIATRGALLSAMPPELTALRDRRVLPGRPESIARIEIERPGLGFVQLMRANGQWYLHQPIREQADSGAVERLLDAAHALTVARFVWDPPSERSSDTVVLTEPPATHVETYGLADDNASMRLRLWSTGSEPVQELFLGKVIEEHAEIYARRRGQATVFTLPAQAVQKLHVGLNDLRRRELIALEPRRVRYLALEKNARRLVLAWDETSGWSIRHPSPWRADNPTVEALVKRIVALRATAFHNAPEPWEPEPDALRLTLATREPGDANPAGRADTTEIVSLVFGPVVDKLQGVRVSGRAGLLMVEAHEPARLSAVLARPAACYDRTVLALEADHIQALTAQRNGEARTVRRRADGSWESDKADAGIDEPALAELLFHLRNLRAVRVVAEAETGTHSYGFDEARNTLTIGLGDGEGLRKIILFGASAPGGGIYTRVRGQEMVFILDPSQVERLLRSPIERPNPDAS